MTDFAKGTSHGGRNGFQIQHGGHIRISLEAEADAVYREGSVVQMNSDAELELSTDQNTLLTGITDTRRDPIGDPFNDHTTGSGKATIVLDPAVVETIELTSGAVFQPNSKVFQDGAGKWNSDPAATDNRVYGTALNLAVANAGDTLRMFYEAQGPA